MPDDEYPPESIRVLAALEPPVRDPNDPRVRWCREFLGLDDDDRPVDIERTPMSVHDALATWAEGLLSVERALELTHAADVAEMIVLCHVNEVSRPLLGGPVTRVALRAEDLTDAEMAAIMASRPIGPDYSLDDIPDEES